MDIQCSPDVILSLPSNETDILSADSRFQFCSKQKVLVRLGLNNSNFVRVVVCFVSLCGIITLMLRHIAKARWLNEDLPADMLNSVYLTGGLDLARFKHRAWFKSSFWFEAFIFVLTPIPYYDWISKFDFINMSTHQGLVSTYYLGSDFILAFKFLRIYFVIRAVFNYVQYMDLYSKKLCKKYGFTANIRFTFKALLRL